jgi:hypothetical protein
MAVIFTVPTWPGRKHAAGCDMTLEQIKDELLDGRDLSKKGGRKRQLGGGQVSHPRSGPRGSVNSSGVGFQNSISKAGGAFLPQSVTVSGASNSQKQTAARRDCRGIFGSRRRLGAGGRCYAANGISAMIFFQGAASRPSADRVTRPTRSNT